MKKQLTGLTSTYFFPYDGVLTKHHSYTQTQGSFEGFTDAISSFSASSERNPLFKKASTIFLFSFDLHFSSGTIAVNGCHIHYVSSLNV